MTDPTAPLKGFRVLDLTNVLSGPYCCYQLALMGAEVIKVERPGSGDLARQLGADQNRNDRNMGISFLAQNAGKKSITLNLKSKEGIGVLQKLVKSADVLVENFRPGVMDRLGVGYNSLKTHKPSLVYCAISGFGQTGPLNQRPAYDQIIQGLSGMMAITGDEHSAPLRVGYPLADTIGGMAAAFSISAALHAKPRGSFIDVSMLESVVSTMGWAVSNFLIGGVAPKASGNENNTSAPSGAFRTASGLLNIAANEEKQWQLLVTHLKLDNLFDDPRFATRDTRKQHRMALREQLEDVLMTRDADEWEQELCDIGVPAGSVLTVQETLASEQLQSRNLLSTQTLPDTKEQIEVTDSPFLLDGERPGANSPPPEIGKDNDDVYASLGYDPQQRLELKQRGVI